MERNEREGGAWGNFKQTLKYINFIVNLKTTFKICIFADRLDKSTKTLKTK